MPNSRVPWGLGVGGIRIQSLGFNFILKNILVDLLKNDIFNVIMILTDYDLIDICNTICVT